MNKIYLKKILIWAIIIVISTAAIGTTLNILNSGRKGRDDIYHADIMLSNEQIKIWYTDEAACVGNYTNDTVEPHGWKLLPSLYWDSNGNSIFEDDETIATTLSPLVHFTESGQDYIFYPLHQSIMSQPGDAEVLYSGWVSEPNVYASEVKDINDLVTVNSTIRIYSGNNYFSQTFEIESITTSKISNLDLIVYLGIDVNGFFDDYAFIDYENNNMIKAKDNETGVWFGAYPSDNADSFEISIWDDGPAGNEDLWKRCLNNNLNEYNEASDDVEGALLFNLSDLNYGDTESVTIYYSFGNNENDLYFGYYYSVPLNEEWNLVSIMSNKSVHKNNINVNYLGVNYTWQEAVDNGTILGFIYGWNTISQSYETINVLDPGEGYWMYAYGVCDLLMLSNKINDDVYITDLLEKWNLVGLPYNTSLDKGNLTVHYNGSDYPWQQAVDNGTVLGFIYGWNTTNQNYVTSNVLLPEKGYWMYAYEVCTLKRTI
jgi:hypothetical protein